MPTIGPCMPTYNHHEYGYHIDRDDKRIELKRRVTVTMTHKEPKPEDEEKNVWQIMKKIHAI